VPAHVVDPRGYPSGVAIDLVDPYPNPVQALQQFPDFRIIIDMVMTLSVSCERSGD
jgi:hypothetical protein